MWQYLKLYLLFIICNFFKYWIKYFVCTGGFYFSTNQFSVRNSEQMYGFTKPFIIACYLLIQSNCSWKEKVESTTAILHGLWLVSGWQYSRCSISLASVWQPRVILLSHNWPQTSWFISSLAPSASYLVRLPELQNWGRQDPTYFSLLLPRLIFPASLTALLSSVFPALPSLSETSHIAGCRPGELQRFR